MARKNSGLSAFSIGDDTPCIWRVSDDGRIIVSPLAPNDSSPPAKARRASDCRQPSSDIGQLLASEPAAIGQLTESPKSRDFSAKVIPLFTGR